MVLDASEINQLATTAVGTAIKLYQGVESFEGGGAMTVAGTAGALIAGDPRSMAQLVKVMVTDLHNLQRELRRHAEEGGVQSDVVVDKYEKLAMKCRGFDQLVTQQPARDVVIRELEEIMDHIEDFLDEVNTTLKKIQLLRDRAATTWQGVTTGAGIAVAGGAAALCVLAGPALPVLAPLIAAGVSFTGVAVTSHVAFTPTIGNQIANMDTQITQLSALKRTMAVQRLKANTAHGALTQGGASTSSTPLLGPQGGNRPLLIGSSNTTSVITRVEEY